MYSLSNHAAIRASQRSISNSEIDLIMTMGRETKQPGKAIKIELDRKTSNSVVRELKGAIKLIEKAQKKAIILSESSSLVITVMNSDS